MGGEGDKLPRSTRADSKDLPPFTSASFVDATPDFGSSNSLAGLFSLAPLTPAPLPRCLPMGLDVEIPTLAADGSVEGSGKRRIEFDEPISSSKPIVLYAVPRSVVDVVHDESRGVCEPPYDETNACEADDSTPLFPVFGPQPLVFGPQQTFTPPNTSRPPPALPVEPAVPKLEVLELAGDFALTRHYSAHAVGAGSLTVVRSEHGAITLIDAGVGKVAHSEITQRILAELAVEIGDATIAEVLLSHAHDDHTSLLPELASRYPIGKIRINAYQHQDPRMLKILRAVANNTAERIRKGVTAKAEANRSAWEIDPARGELEIDAAAREAAWNAHVESLVQAELVKSAIKLEVAFTDASGVVRVTESPLLGELMLPKTPGAPAMLEQGLLEASSTTGPRITTARPSVAYDLDALIQKQSTASDAEGREAADRVLDANEVTFVIELGSKTSSAARIFVSPDKRVPDLASMKSVLEADVARLNKALADLGRKPATLQIWNMTHHAQLGFITGQAQFHSLVDSLYTLTRVKQASGAVTMDVVLVSGQVSADPKIDTLVDPLTIWALNEMGIDVVVATDKTVEVLEVLLGDGTTVTGLTQAPFKTGIASIGTLRNVETALRKLRSDIAALEVATPARKGTPTAQRQPFIDKARELEALVKRLEKARKEYVEYHEEKLRPKPGQKTAPGVAPGDPEAAAKRAAIDVLLADERVKSVVEDAAAKTPVFDPVALTLMKRPAGGIPAELVPVIDAIVRVDALRQKLAEADTVEARVEFAKELTALQPLLTEHLKIAPEGTKQLVTDMIKSIDSELGQVTKPAAGGDVTTATTPDGEFSVEQRLQFEKAKPVAGDGVRWFADKTTRPLGALMIYSIVKKQGDLNQGFTDDKIGLAEYTLGTVHSAYGVSIGVRMLQKVPISNHEFAILAVVDILETSSRHYASSEQRWTAIEYSLIRNVLSVGLNYLGTWMMQRKNRYVAAAGFLIQFAVDPFLEWVGLYSWLDKKNDFMPDDVHTARKRIEGLMSEYTVLIGLLELSRRDNLSAMSRDAKVNERIQSDITSYRSKVTKTEASLLAAFDNAYYTAKTSYAGLPELDLMRAQFTQMQHLAHQGDTENVVTSRKQIMDAFAKIEDNVNLDWLSDEAILGMGQWHQLDVQLYALERQVRPAPDWEEVREIQVKLEQVLGNARYRLDPGPRGLRTTPLLTPGTQAHATYVTALETREARAAKIHEQLFGFQVSVPTNDPVEDAIARADQAVAAYVQALGAMPAFEGLTAKRLEESSYDLAKAYPDYIDDHDDYAAALDKLHSAEQMLKSTVTRMDALTLAIRNEPVSSTVTSRVDAIHEAMAVHVADRIKNGLLFADEAKQRAIDIRAIENADIAKRLGDKAAHPLSTPERMAIIQRELPLSTSSSTMDLLNAMPMLSRVGADGYMVGIYRYVGWDSDASKNALVGDLRRTIEVADAMSDGDRDAHLFVPLNKAASDIQMNHFIFFIAPILGRSPFADVPTSIMEFDDDEKAALVPVKLEELKP